MHRNCFRRGSMRNVVAGGRVCAGVAGQTIRIIVPFPRGQGADIVGRLIAERLSAELAQQVIVENRAGGGSMVGTAYAARMPADGYALFLGGTSAMVICVNPSFPAHTIQGLIKIAKDRPHEITYGSSGNGSTHHLVQPHVRAGKARTLGKSGEGFRGENRLNASSVNSEKSPTVAPARRRAAIVLDNTAADGLCFDLFRNVVAA